MMSKLLFKSVLLLTLAAFLISCTGTYYVNASHTRNRVKETVLSLTAGKSVALINDYTSAHQVAIYKHADGTRWLGDLRQYTDAAISILQSELNLRDVFVVEKHFKTISLKISDVNATNKAFDKTTSLKLTATLGNGEATTISSSYRTGGTSRHALDGAIIAAITKLLNSKTVVGYINK